MATELMDRRASSSRVAVSVAGARLPVLPRVLAFALSLGLVLMYALRGGGSYDPVSFQEWALVVWFALGCGVALGVFPRQRPHALVTALLIALAGYAAWNAASLLWTQSTELTVQELTRALGYLGICALGALALDRHTWRWAAAGVGMGGLVVCVFAFGSRVAPGIFGHDHIDAVLHVDRLAFPFGYWNTVAAWGAMCTALGLTWSAHDPSRMRRAVALALVPLSAGVTYLTYSRGGIGGTAFAAVLALALSRNRVTVVVHAAAAAAGAALVILAIRAAPAIAHGTGQSGAGGVIGTLAFAAALCGTVAFFTRRLGLDRWRPPQRLRRPLAALALVVIALPAAAIGPRLVKHGWRSFTHRASTTVSSTTNTTGRLTSLSGARYVVWKSALKDFDQHPADGTGAGTFEFWWNQHASDDGFIRDVHSIWLENMAELGIPGLLLIVAVAVAAIAVAVAACVRARRTRSAGPAAAFLAAWLVYLLHASADWMWESTAVTVLALAGITTVGARLGGGALRLGLSARAAFVALAAVAALVQLPGILSATDLRRSQAARAGDPGAALTLAHDAVSAAPWSASAHEQEALVLESSGRLVQAKHQESLAISDEPNNYAHWLVRARIETEMLELGAAVRDYQRSHALRPRALVFTFAPPVK